MASKRPISLEEEDGDGTSPRPPKRSQPCHHHCCREAMENLASVMEQKIGRKMQEEVQSIRMLLNHAFPALSSPRPPISNLISGVSRFRLDFDNKLPQILFTYRKIEAVGRVPLHIVIRDARSNEIVSSGPFSTLKIRIVVLNGKFCGDGREWTKDEFMKTLVPQRRDKRPLLIGALEFSLSNGVSRTIDAKFSDNSSWSVDGFRLAAMVSDDMSLCERVLEAISEAFRVKDCRVESNQKFDPPLLNDKVWRLRSIRRDGPLHRKLADAEIDTVQDFLRSLTMDPDRLCKLVGRPKKIWDTIVEHARECTLGSKLYSYCIEEKEIVLVFNSIFELVGANINNGLYRLLSALSNSEKELVENLKSIAFKNSENMDEFYGSLDEIRKGIESAPVPEQFLCPLSSKIMKDPVVLASGQTYDRPFIEEWLNSGHRTCPKTQQVLTNPTLTPNHLVRSMISQWCSEHGIALPAPYINNPDNPPIPASERNLALGGPINTNVSLSMPQCPVASTSIPGSSSLQISTLPSRQLDLQQRHPESVSNELSDNQHKDTPAGESFHCAQQSTSYQTNNLDASKYINHGEQYLDFFALCEVPIYSDEEMEEFAVPEVADQKVPGDASKYINHGEQNLDFF